MTTLTKTNLQTLTQGQKDTARKLVCGSGVQIAKNYIEKCLLYNQNKCVHCGNADIRVSKQRNDKNAYIAKSEEAFKSQYICNNCKKRF